MKKKYKWIVTFEAKQVAQIEVEADSLSEAQTLANKEYVDTGLEGKWDQKEPRIKTLKPVCL